MFKSIKNILAGDASTDIAFRYIPIVDLIEKNNLGKSKILEIGSGDLGITPYFSGDVTGIDVSFEQPSSLGLKKIQIVGPAYPFENDKFDVSISVDAFEHIKPEERLIYLKEIFRVTKNFFVLVLPTGNQSYEHDKELGEYFFKIHHREDRFIKEHLENNLPGTTELRRELYRAAESSGKQIEIRQEQKLLNLKFRRWLMKLKISRSRIKKIIYFAFLPLTRFYRLFNFGECYRTLFLISMK